MASLYIITHVYQEDVFTSYDLLCINFLFCIHYFSVGVDYFNLFYLVIDKEVCIL